MRVRRRDVVHRRGGAAPGVRAEGLFVPAQLPAERQAPARVRLGEEPRLGAERASWTTTATASVAERKLHRGSPALGKFYICTDGAPVNLWRFIDRAIVDILPGAKSLFSKLPLPGWSFMYPLGYACESLGAALGKKFKLTTFSVRMLLINRHFDSVGERAGSGVRAHRRAGRGVDHHQEVVQGGVAAQARAQEVSGEGGREETRALAYLMSYFSLFACRCDGVCLPACP